MYTWFQNLNESGQRGLNFRGSIGPSYDRIYIQYEFHTGWALRLQFKIRRYPSAQISLGLIFFTLYLSFPFKSFPRMSAESLQTGFYVYDWAIVWSWMESPWGDNRSSKDPWWRHFYFRIDDFFLGPMKRVETQLREVSDVFFTLGEHEFKMNSIKWVRQEAFRTRIPFFLWHRRWTALEMKIDKPPMRSGKGENSYDCDDDGCFGLYCRWPHDEPGFLGNDGDQMASQAVDIYVANTLQDAAKYGGSNGPRGIKKNSIYRYIGRRIERRGEMEDARGPEGVH